MYWSLDSLFSLNIFKVAISPSIDCPGIGCGTSKSMRLSTCVGEGRGGDSIVEVKGPGLLLPVGVGPGDWRELPAVGD